MPTRHPASALIVAVLLVTVVSFPAAATQGDGNGNDVVPTTGAIGTDGPTQQVDGSATCNYEQLYDRTIESVVQIRTQTGLGSGFVYEATNGTALVVTNQHVIADQSNVTVRFSRGDSRMGTVLGTTVQTDLAVVRVDETPDYVGALPLADSTPSPGEYVAAIGSPYGLEATITSGIVSGINRSMPTEQGLSIPSTVQTDAPINPGNSGGPLVGCENGTVIGVNRAGGGENIGFAIAAPIVERVVPALAENGTVDYAFLGVRTTEVTPPIAEANDLNTTRGLYVIDTVRGTNASRVLEDADRLVAVGDQRVPAGGDTIVAIEGMQVDNHEDLVSYLLTETRPGDTVELTVLRDGQRQTVSVELGERPDPDTGPA